MSPETKLEIERLNLRDKQEELQDLHDRFGIAALSVLTDHERTAAIIVHALANRLDPQEAIAIWSWNMADAMMLERAKRLQRG